ncbi:MAG: MBL fold metallo-hydrolase [Clostridiales bacterium]|nr:MBL fold metallo-hydrolase [Clostridiales bacterium]
MENKKITVGIFWIADEGCAAAEKSSDLIYDKESYEYGGGSNFINYSGSHFDMWCGLAAEQYGGKYKNYDCYHFPRGRLLYDCVEKKMLVYIDIAALAHREDFETELKAAFGLDKFEYRTDEHYQSETSRSHDNGIFVDIETVGLKETDRIVRIKAMRGAGVGFFERTINVGEVSENIRRIIEITQEEIDGGVSEEDAIKAFVKAAKSYNDKETTLIFDGMFDERLLSAISKYVPDFEYRFRVLESEYRIYGTHLDISQSYRAYKKPYMIFGEPIRTFVMSRRMNGLINKRDFTETERGNMLRYIADNIGKIYTEPNKDFSHGCPGIVGNTISGVLSRLVDYCGKGFFNAAVEMIIIDFRENHCRGEHDYKMFPDDLYVDSAANEVLSNVLSAAQELMNTDFHDANLYCGINQDIDDYITKFYLYSLKYDIIRGRDTIGANLIEISYYKYKFLLELGNDLNNATAALTELEKEVLAKEYRAIFISHYHADHAGLIGKTDRPVYMGAACKRIMETVYAYTKRKMPERVRIFEDGVHVKNLPIIVTPYLCDHSAYDSYMLSFEAGDRKILYTGDFRGGGRKDLDKLLSKLPKGVDVLICEGTNLGQGKECAIKTEKELEAAAVKLMKASDKPVFVLQPSTNIDRLVSVYRAAKRCGRKLYVDDFQAQITFATGNPHIPNPDGFDDVFAFTPRAINGERYEKFGAIENKKSTAQIAKDSRAVILIRQSMLSFIKNLAAKQSLNGATLIYSMWNGYKQKDDMKKFLDEIAALGINIADLHTSGHADAETIERLKKTVNAKEVVYVHTEHGRELGGI